ncbi:MAG: efflux RND transporter periplasmic adaptor subunit, partial [Bacteroidetes bacterium]
MLFSSVFLSGCQSAASEGDERADPASLQAEAPRQPVRVQPVRRGPFAVERHATGVLRPARKVEVVSSRGGRILQLPIREGQRVAQGQLLALIDTTELHFELRQALLALEEAEYQKNDMLVMQGGRWGVDTSVSRAVLDNLLIVSGLKRAREALRRLEHARTQCFVRAPFAGRVAEVEVAEGAMVQPGHKLCALLDESTYEAEFMLLEQEAAAVRPGMHVRVEPLALEGRSFGARIHSINPVVSEEGLVRVRARLEKGARAAGTLMDGMQVRVVIERVLPDRIVVPRAAVVLRSARPVVFTYDAPSQRAKWHYVTIEAENSEEVAISEGLEGDEMIIVEGNLTLDHDALVQLA